MLRAEEMDRADWWWCVCDLRADVYPVDSSHEVSQRFKTGKRARRAAEDAARAYLRSGQYIGCGMRNPIDWAFGCPARTAVIATRQVLAGAHTLFVTRFHDERNWLFAHTSETEAKGQRIVSIGELLRGDPSLCDLADLSPGDSASRERHDEPWQRP